MPKPRIPLSRRGTQRHKDIKNDYDRKEKEKFHDKNYSIYDDGFTIDPFDLPDGVREANYNPDDFDDEM